MTTVLDPDAKALGNRVRFIRLAKRMSQEDVAKRLGTVQSEVSRYELGKRSPTLSEIKEIAAALEVSPDQLIGPGGVVIETEF